MKIKEAAFVTSSTDISQCPKPDRNEYAFIGRSNVGKSSLINMLTGRNHLAKISGNPGKTQTINHFIINDEWYLVDLPGYGYAKISKKEREKWEGFIADYLENRENLRCIFVLIDLRHTAQQIDLDFMYKLGSKGLPFVIIFTKHDKLKEKQVNINLDAYKAKLFEYWEELPEYFVSSAVTGVGRERVLNFIESVNEQYDAH